MSFDWGDYLGLADLLCREAEKLGQEAALRSAASRAYYAAFCSARNHARDRHGFAPTYDARDHHAVRMHFRSRRTRQVAFKLYDLLQWRGLCDYKDTVGNLPLIAHAALLRAREVVEQLT